MLVGSYPTVSPLPGTNGPAVCFLWHFPSGHPGLLLATTLPCGVRTFLGDGQIARRRGRPVGSSIALSRLPAPEGDHAWPAHLVLNAHKPAEIPPGPNRTSLWPVHLLDVVLLLAAGVSAGMINAVAGGGSLITFPSLIAAGLPPIPANVTNSVAVCPGYLASVAGSRTDLPGHRQLVGILPTALVGTVAGCILLLLTPPRAFELVVPFLVLGATAALAFQDRLRRLVGHPRDLAPRRRALAVQTMIGLGSVYGGYFGAALGIMLVAGLALMLDEKLARISAIKNLLSAVVGLTTVAIFATFGPVDWLAVAVLAPATIAGGYVGARIVRRLPSAVLKAVIVTFGAVIGFVLLVRAVR